MSNRLLFKCKIVSLFMVEFSAVAVRKMKFSVAFCLINWINKQNCHYVRLPMWTIFVCLTRIPKIIKASPWYYGTYHIGDQAGCGSSIGSVFVWHTSGPEFDPHVRHILSWRLGHDNISTAILPLPLIQEEQLSVTGERMCTKYWKTAWEACPGWMDELGFYVPSTVFQSFRDDGRVNMKGSVQWSAV